MYQAEKVSRKNKSEYCLTLFETWFIKLIVMTKKIIKMQKRLNLQKGYEEGEVKVKEHDHIA